MEVGYQAAKIITYSFPTPYLGPGTAVAEHVHASSSEILYVERGSVEVTVGGKTLRATSGDTVYLPAGVPHSAKVLGHLDPLRGVQVYVGPGPEQRCAKGKKGGVRTNGTGNGAGLSSLLDSGRIGWHVQRVRSNKNTKEIWDEVHRRRRVDARLRRAAFRFEASKVERAWAIVSAHRAGHSVRDIAAEVGLSPARIHQILGSADANIVEPRLGALRELGWPAPEDCDDVDSPSEQISDRLADEADLLRQCAQWLQALGQRQRPKVNLRPDQDEPDTLYVAVDRARIEQILERIAFDLDELARARRLTELTTADIDAHPVQRHRRKLAEPPIPYPSGPMSIHQTQQALEAYEARLREAGLPVQPNALRQRRVQ